ncbi:protein LAZY 1 [Malania oleifera]|uniref:protein LAZY 1 n=1 Tax=Malania oleifera TaxID=397392 RepID=UPI0025ADFB5F|nr:protein LAZY 1 [Malania oleifera]
MKLLRWVHHKLWQNNIDPCKDFTIGNSCTCLATQQSPNDQQHCTNPSFDLRPLNQNQKECQKSSAEFAAKKVEDDFEEESSTDISELFQGFLTIGTLGTELMLQDPTTPTFAMSFKNIMENETEMIDNDLKLINEQLEKFIETEAKTERCKEPTGRNSHVSTIRLSSKQVEGAGIKEGEKPVVCPLEGYFFGSAIEIPETRPEVKKEKASLGELFQKSKIADDHSTVKCEKGDVQSKRTHKSAMHLMKKMLKKLHASTRSSTTYSGDAAANSVSTKRKLNKVLRIFHRKIHPESTMDAKAYNESKTYELTNNPYYNSHVNGDLKFLDEDNRRFSHISVSKEGVPCHKTNLNLPESELSTRGTSGSREHWIKTDADYLVLEL